MASMPQEDSLGMSKPIAVSFPQWKKKKSDTFTAQGKVSDWQKWSTYPTVRTLWQPFKIQNTLG